MRHAAILITALLGTWAFAAGPAVFRPHVSTL